MTIDGRLVKPTDHYCTPKPQLQIVYDVIGYPELDPCSNKHSFVEAGEAWEEGGLIRSLDPFRTLYLNPPYSLPRLWAERVLRWYAKDRRREAMLLLNAETGTAYWQNTIWPMTAVAYFPPRIKFYLQGVLEPNPKKNQVLIYVGRRVQRAFSRMPSPSVWVRHGGGRRGRA